MSVYRVTGSLRFRGHAPGEEFVATLDPNEERRAVRRRNIEVLQHSRVSIEAHRVRPPKG